MSELPRPSAFAGDARAAAALSAAKALWWASQGVAVRLLTRPTRGPQKRRAEPSAPPPGASDLRKAWLEAFTKDAADVRDGVYPLTERLARPSEAIAQALDFLTDARDVDRRRRQGGGIEVRDTPEAEGYPAYYKQNFHFQTGGWFSDDSARRYETQVEALFAGTAGAMRRRALSLLARALRCVDQRGLRIVDLACGAGSFLSDLKATFPRADLCGLDLSEAYLRQAAARSGVRTVQANVEQLPFADGSIDALSCIYLFHELPPRVRPLVAAEMARVLKPGGVLAFGDSVQGADAPELERLLQVFPVFFHEPFYDSFQKTDLTALFGAVGLVEEGRDTAFLTTARLYRKAG